MHEAFLEVRGEGLSVNLPAYAYLKIALPSCPSYMRITGSNRKSTSEKIIIVHQSKLSFVHPQ